LEFGLLKEAVGPEDIVEEGLNEAGLGRVDLQEVVLVELGGQTCLERLKVVDELGGKVDQAPDQGGQGGVLGGDEGFLGAQKGLGLEELGEEMGFDLAAGGRAI
jgi:hypothetical protein